MNETEDRGHRPEVRNDSRKFACFAGKHPLSLPHFEHTEDAVRFGVTINRDQFVLLTGARDALQREFDRLKANYETHKNDTALLQIMADLATTISKMREALEVAPDIVLASVIPNSDLLARNSHLAAEPPLVGHL